MQFRHFSTFVFKHFSQKRFWVRVFVRNFCALSIGRYVSRGRMGDTRTFALATLRDQDSVRNYALSFSMHDETVETYTNVYARWFAIISQFIVTASLCTLWRLQMTRYSQVLVHSTVVNYRLSHQYMSISLIFLSCFGIYSDFSYFLPDLCWLFSGFWAEFGCCFGDFCSFSYFFSALWLGLGCCFWVFCSFSYFFSAFLRLLG